MIVGGFHYSDCVKKVGKMALNIGINCLVDLELTDYFLIFIVQIILILILMIQKDLKNIWFKNNKIENLNN